LINKNTELLQYQADDPCCRDGDDHRSVTFAEPQPRPEPQPDPAKRYEGAGSQRQHAQGRTPAQRGKRWRRQLRRVVISGGYGEGGVAEVRDDHDHAGEQWRRRSCQESMMRLQHPGTDHRQAVQPHLRSEHEHERGQCVSAAGAVRLGKGTREERRAGEHRQPGGSQYQQGPGDQRRRCA